MSTRKQQNSLRQFDSPTEKLQRKALWFEFYSKLYNTEQTQDVNSIQGYQSDSSKGGLTQFRELFQP